MVGDCRLTIDGSTIGDRRSTDWRLTIASGDWRLTIASAVIVVIGLIPAIPAIPATANAKSTIVNPSIRKSPIVTPSIGIRQPAIGN
jgi:hypothetical protein